MNHSGSRRDALKILAMGGLSTALGGRILSAQEPKRKPNVIVILVDDMGWTDAGCQGSDFYETPNIDRLAAEGIRFTNGYAACPVSSPTRASIMTGKYPARLGLTDWLYSGYSRIDSPIIPATYLDHLPAGEITLAEYLKDAGYSTCHIGKWHLGRLPYYPENQGFDVNIGGTFQGHPKSYFFPQWLGNPPIEGLEGEYLTDRLTAEAIQFLEVNREKPFFLYLAHYAVHTPIEGKEDLVRKYLAKEKGIHDNAVYAAMLEGVDEGVGKILSKLDELGIAENTVIFFTSDNGGLSVEEGQHTPATSNAPLREGKGYLYEGGIRVPFLARWKGVIPSGAVSDVPVASIDLLPTVCEISGIPIAESSLVDGKSLLPVMTGSGVLSREALYWHYPHFSPQGGKPSGAIRIGDYKLIERYEDGTLELYNLRNDSGEAVNLAGAQTGIAKSMHENLIAWRQTVQAKMPLPNPNFK